MIPAKPILLDIVVNPPPEEILLDSSFIASATISQLEHHIEVREFIEKMIANETVAVYSHLTELEFWNVCLKLEVERQEGIPREKAMQHLKNNSSILKRYVKQCTKYMELFVDNMARMRALNVQIADVVKDEEAMAKAAIYNLYTYDTLQIATALYCGLENIAALDKHISKKCDGLKIYTVVGT